MTIELNGQTFTRARIIRADRVARRTDIRYNTQGDMLIDLVCRRYELEVEFALLTENELAQLRAATSDIFVRVRFSAPEGMVEGDFYAAQEPAPAVTQVNGVTMYGAVRLLLKEK